jgi:hypothetical protein
MSENRLGVLVHKGVVVVLLEHLWGSILLHSHTRFLELDKDFDD